MIYQLLSLAGQSCSSWCISLSLPWFLSFLSLALSEFSLKVSAFGNAKPLPESPSCHPPISNSVVKSSQMPVFSPVSLRSLLGSGFLVQSPTGTSSRTFEQCKFTGHMLWWWLSHEVTSESWDPIDCSLPGSSVHGDSLGKNAGVGCQFLLQGIFPTQESIPGLLHCRQILYQLSYEGSGAIFG